ncbi:MAG: O-antigen ligase family protein, partial [Variovorax sp.]
MALALSREEAVWALRGFLAMSVAGLAMIALYYSVGFPMTEAFRGLLVLVGNKSISNALLLTIFGATAAVLGLALLTGHRPWRALVAFGFTVAVVAVITLTLLSRTSLLALLLAIGLACVHQWRRQLRALAVAMVLGGAVVGVAVWQTPTVQHKFELGVQELEAAQAGAVSEGSWVVRYYMYRDTARMIMDKPLTGWGIGGWTEQWHLRGPKLLADYNMPHNDFLWMGAQAGLPGALSLLAIILVGLWQAWRRPDLTGRFALMAMFVLLVATSANSALRDAQIGLSLLWVAMIYLRMVQEP